MIQSYLIEIYYFQNACTSGDVKRLKTFATRAPIGEN